MKTLELFCGTKSFSKAARERAYTTLTVDNNSDCKPDLCVDVNDFYKQLVKGKFKEKDFDIIWASPPCTTFSVASISTHWKGGKEAYEPKTKACKDAINLIKTTLKIIKLLKPKYWFIENPRGVLRKLPMLKKLHRVTITYCQYGDSRMKPTDIWTNCLSWKPKQMCKNGDTCHEAAPRGSRTGTQGLKGAKERGIIPRALFNEIFNTI